MKFDVHFILAHIVGGKRFLSKVGAFLHVRGVGFQEILKVRNEGQPAVFVSKRILKSSPCAFTTGTHANQFLELKGIEPLTS